MLSKAEKKQEKEILWKICTQFVFNLIFKQKIFFLKKQEDERKTTTHTLQNWPVVFKQVSYY